MSTTNPTDTITEWEELQIKYGNYPERPKTVTNEEISEKLVELAESIDPLDRKPLKELEKLEDRVDEDILQAYRERRLRELKRLKADNQFNQVYHISQADYVSEVTNAAVENRVVILHLYTPSKPVCVLLNRGLDQLAQQHQYIKFCKAIGTHIIPNIPEGHLPTVLVYYKQQCIHQFLGGHVWGNDACCPRAIEYVLWASGLLKFSKVKGDPRPPGSPAVPKLLNQSEDLPLLRSSSESEESPRSAPAKGYTSTILDRAMRFA